MIFTNYRQPGTLLLTPQFCSTSKIVFLSLIFFLQLPFLSNNQILANNHPEDSGKSYTKCGNVIKKFLVKILHYVSDMYNTTEKILNSATHTFQNYRKIKFCSPDYQGITRQKSLVCMYYFIAQLPR